MSHRHVCADVIVQTWPTLFADSRRVYKLAAEGVLPCVRVGRRVYFDLSRIEEWVQAGGQALPGGWRRFPDTADADQNR